MKVAILCLLLTSFSAKAQFIHDESYLDKSFWEFKAQLETCILMEDKEALETYLADQIIVGAYTCEGGSGCSKEEFMKYHFGDNGMETETWRQMKAVTRWGFKRLDHTIHTSDQIIPKGQIRFQAPSFKTKIDEEQELIILGENVNIREKPSLKARIIQQASYEKFACDCNINDQKETTYQNREGMVWIEVYLKKGKVGYVSAQYCSYTLEKELTIAKVKGKWKIISFFTPIGC